MNKNQTNQPAVNTAVTYTSVLTSVKNSLNKTAASQLTTATNHLLSAVGKELDSTVGPELLDQFEQTKHLIQQRFIGLGLADSSYQSTLARLSTLRTAALNFIANSTLPSGFSAALTALIQKSGHSYSDVALYFGEIVNKWRLNACQPKETSIDKLRQLEKFLEAPGALIARLPHLVRQANVVDDLNPTDGLPVEFGRCLKHARLKKGFTIRSLVNAVRADCPSLGGVTVSRWERGTASPIKLERDVVQSIEKHLGLNGPLLKRYDDVNAAVSPYSPVRLVKKPYGLWNDLLETQFDHLAWFKSTPQLPPDLKRNKEGFWAKDASRKMWKQLIKLFVGCCHLPTDEPDPMLRGAGIPESDLSLALLLDYELVLKFCDFRKGRNAAGKYNASTVSFIAGLRNLVHPESGYFTQHPGRFCNHPRLKALLPKEVQVKVLHRWETRPLLSTEESFVALCETVYNRANEFLNNLTRGGLAAQTRDPSRHIKLILAQDRPLDCLLILRERMEKVELLPLNHDKNAVHIQNIALVALMTVKPLRVRTLADLRLGEIFRNDDGSWSAAVPKERFKNERFGARDGWFGKIHSSVWPALDQYSSIARPVLTKGKACDYFWVGAKGGRFSEGAIHTRFLAFTKAFIPDFAPDGINPHAFRKIVAHDNLKTDRLNAVTKSAQQLNDLPKTVKKSYDMDKEPLRNEWVDQLTDIRFKNRKHS